MGRFAAINVLDYGADNTGTADASTAIQAAIDAADHIMFPAGDFKIDTTLTVDGHKQLNGFGIDNTRLIKSTAGAIMRVNSGAGTTTQYGSVRGLTFQGSATADIGVRVGQTATSPNSANHYCFQGLKFVGFDTCGCRLEASQINYFDECVFTGNEDGLFVDQDGGGNNTDNIFRNCSFRYNLGRGVFMQGYQHFLFDGCTFEFNDEEGLSVDRETAGTVCKALRVRNCYFESNNDGRGSGDYGQILMTATGGVVQDTDIEKCYLSSKGTGNHHIVLGLGRFRLNDNFTDDDTLGESTNTSQCRVEIKSRYAPSAFVLNNSSIVGTYEHCDINNGIKDFYRASSSSWVQQSYTESNVTTYRTFDANATTLDELADVVGTLIGDLRDQGFIS